jgi:hypothetical protein
MTQVRDDLACTVRLELDLGPTRLVSEAMRGVDGDKTKVVSETLIQAVILVAEEESDAPHITGIRQPGVAVDGSLGRCESLNQEGPAFVP